MVVCEHEHNTEKNPGPAQSVACYAEEIAQADCRWYLCLQSSYPTTYECRATFQSPARLFPEHKNPCMHLPLRITHHPRTEPDISSTLLYTPKKLMLVLGLLLNENMCLFVDINVRVLCDNRCSDVQICMNLGSAGVSRFADH